MNSVRSDDERDRVTGSPPAGSKGDGKDLCRIRRRNENHTESMEGTESSRAVSPALAVRGPMDGSGRHGVPAGEHERCGRRDGRWMDVRQGRWESLGRDAGRRMISAAQGSGRAGPPDARSRGASAARRRAVSGSFPRRRPVPDRVSGRGGGRRLFAIGRRGCRLWPVGGGAAAECRPRGGRSFFPGEQVSVQGSMEPSRTAMRGEQRG